jgi:EAL domain-containing protein (putative c-di-GMP-specific phosphodiesterase class I)
VNGERVQEAALRDGDLVAFADIKFHFHMPSAEEEAPSQTDVIEPDTPATECKPNVRDVIDRIRKMHEVIIHRAFSNSFLPVACLDNHAVIGMDYAGIDDGTFGSHREELMRLMEVDCPLTQSMCQMLRLAATEDFAESQREGFLFLRLRGFELARTGLLWELRKLGNIARKPGFVVIGLPYAALAEVPGTREIIQYVRSLGLGIAFTDFDGNYEQLQLLGTRPGEFFKLAEALTRDIEESSERQEKLIEIVTSAKEHQGVLIATGIQTAAESEVFRTVGCHLGEGPLFMSS